MTFLYEENQPLSLGVPVLGKNVLADMLNYWWLTPRWVVGDFTSEWDLGRDFSVLVLLFLILKYESANRSVCRFFCGRNAMPPMMVSVSGALSQ